MSRRFYNIKYHLSNFTNANYLPFSREKKKCMEKSLVSQKMIGTSGRGVICCYFPLQTSLWVIIIYTDRNLGIVGKTFCAQFYDKMLSKNHFLPSPTRNQLIHSNVHVITGPFVQTNHFRINVPGFYNINLVKSVKKICLRHMESKLTKIICEYKIFAMVEKAGWNKVLIVSHTHAQNVKFEHCLAFTNY